MISVPFMACDTFMLQCWLLRVRLGNYFDRQNIIGRSPAMKKVVEKVAQVAVDGRGSHPQLVSATKILQEIRPDILLINEIDAALSAND